MTEIDIYTNVFKRHGYNLDDTISGYNSTGVRIIHYTHTHYIGANVYYNHITDSVIKYELLFVDRKIKVRVSNDLENELKIHNREKTINEVIS